MIEDCPPPRDAKLPDYCYTPNIQFGIGEASNIDVNRIEQSLPMED